MRSRTLLATVLLAGSALAGCTSGSADPGQEPDDVARALAAGLTAGDLTGVPVTGKVAPEKLRARVSEGMEEATPTVSVQDVTESGDGSSATAALDFEWDLPDTDATWTSTGTVDLDRVGEAWKVALSESAWGLKPGEVLQLSAVAPERAPITGRGGAAIVEDRPVLRFGIDKTRVGPGRQAASARALAAAVDVDPAAFVAQVKAAGEKAFVEAIVLREAEAQPQLQAVAGIPGAGVVADTLPLAPTREFARPILGSVGPVTAEMVKKSDGAYASGDEAGLSGLQQRYDERLRGTPGWVVTATRSTGQRERSRRLFRLAPVPGAPLRTTLDLRLQEQAERVLADVGPSSALVAVQPSTGDLLAAASGPGSEGYSTATVGQYAPGSTFKVVTSLALLRAGLDPQSRVSCPSTTVVDGKRFKNYDDYPALGLGEITLRQAVANSCNTAFIEQRDRVRDLDQAAAALGLGVDHDLGFPAYFGQVPGGPDGSGGSETAAAAALIGQGEVLASPMAMAAVAASVAQGRTVVPHLLPDVAPTASPDQPLTAGEAEQLRGLMRAVVTEGSGSLLADLPGPPALAKTGTAEFGSEEPLRTHAWMIAVHGDLAVAAFVEVGDSGSGTAGPLLEEFLRSAS
ncbi:penicillin-binding transpeptidase domain-containing protein [Nocardioides mesophilus]|uniref:Beta-lactamase n=1 Tax=Nocardioides mesophilus TaxID=433659 RepID=A0A7G9RFJ6_9ACTN|nr:penicillin-binding transpeptidase domain-containing protein [Nocardioides mesophilus]QNN54371.1 penicillin-binding protein [Nocardioides mesophilus]